jgi:hypothetical protein
MNFKNLMKALTEDPTFVISAVHPATFKSIKLETKSYSKRDELVKMFTAQGCIVTVTKKES